MRNRYFSYFGSFTWAGAAVKRLAEFASSTNFEILGVPVEMRQSMQIENYNACVALGQTMACRLIEDRGK